MVCLKADGIIALKSAARWLTLVVSTMAIVSGLSGCGLDSDADLVAEAKTALAKNDKKTATIHLKAALQKNPQSGEARFLLGEVLFQSGNPAGAAVELEKSREAKFEEARVLPLLAKAYLVSGQAKKVISSLDGVRLTDRKVMAELHAVTAAAFISQGSLEKGLASVEAALQQDPKSAAAKLLKTRLIAGRGAFADAIVTLDGLLADEPKNVEALVLKAELLWLGTGDIESAHKTLQEALVISPRDIAANASLIRLYLEKRDFEGFKAQVANLKKADPNHPETRFYEVQMALVAGDIATAREGVRQLMRITPDNPYALQLAGAVEAKAGGLVLAELYLGKALGQIPGLHLARRQLAQVYLRTGQAPKALTTLQPLLVSESPGAEALALAAEAHQQQGDLDKAEKFYTLAAKADPADARIRTELALSQVSKGNWASGFAQLESLAASDSSTYADLALINAYMRRNDIEAALKSVVRLQAKLAGQPLPHLLHGQILSRRNDPKGARASYEKAVALDRAYLPAIAALALLDLAEQQPSVALKRYEALMALDPNNSRAALAAAELRLVLGAKPEEIQALLLDVIKSNPTEAAPRLALVDLLINQRRAKAALDAAQQAAAALPGDPSVMDALGRAQLASGDVQQAVSTFRKNAVAQSGMVEPQLRLAEAYVVAQDLPSAMQTLRKALEISPKHVTVQRLLVNLAMRQKHADEALGIARVVQKQRPSEPVGFILEGEIHLAQRATDPAIAAFRAALARDKSTAMATRLHAVYSLADRPADAERFAEGWLKEYPKDAAFLFHLGSVAMEKKDYVRAEARYREVLTQSPDNGASLNNLAWLLIKEGKPGALPLAERAQQLLPQQASVLDTLAMAHAAEKQWTKAIDWQRKAIAAAPGVASYRLSLAKLLIDSGNKTEAKAELQKLEALGAKFAEQAEVARMLSSL